MKKIILVKQDGIVIEKHVFCGDVSNLPDLSRPGVEIEVLTEEVQ